MAKHNGVYMDPVTAVAVGALVLSALTGGWALSRRQNAPSTESHSSLTQIEAVGAALRAELHAELNKLGTDVDRLRTDWQGYRAALEEEVDRAQKEYRRLQMRDKRAAQQGESTPEEPEGVPPNGAPADLRSMRRAIERRARARG